MLADYYQSNPGVRDEQPVAKGQPTAEETAEWFEDEDGNFIQRG